MNFATSRAFARDVRRQVEINNLHGKDFAGIEDEGGGEENACCGMCRKFSAKYMLVNVIFRGLLCGEAILNTMIANVPTSEELHDRLVNTLSTMVLISVFMSQLVCDIMTSVAPEIQDSPELPLFTGAWTVCICALLNALLLFVVNVLLLGTIPKSQTRRYINDHRLLIWGSFGLFFLAFVGFCLQIYFW